MPQPQLKTVLNEVIALTSEKDSNALELALAQTLFALAGVKNMLMHSASYINRAKHALSKAETLPEAEQIPEDLIDVLAQCLESAKIANIQHQGNQLTLFPLMCSKVQPLAVIVVEKNNDPHNHELVIQILKIYHNFLSLMNENERDALTGLLNRKTFDQKINTIIADLQNNKNSLAGGNVKSAYLAIFDIDHFKLVNDNHGHLIGDEVLLLLSRLMDQNFRDKDLLFRFGGEEFVGIFECPTDEAISSLLNRFRQVIADYQFPLVGKVTISGGFTKVAPHDLSSKIIDRADVALYHAKNNGRNQIQQHEDLITSGAVSEETNDNWGEIELF